MTTSKSACCGAEIGWICGEKHPLNADGSMQQVCGNCMKPCEPAGEPSFFDKAASEARAANIQPASQQPSAGSDEEFAERCANQRCPEQGPEFIVWCMSRDDVLLGLAEGRRRERERLNMPSDEAIKMIVDQEIAEREERAAREMVGLMCIKFAKAAAEKKKENWLTFDSNEMINRWKQWRAGK